MSKHAKDLNPVTTVWKNDPDGRIRVKTIPGLPYGVPARLGEPVYIEGLGEAICSGISKSGPGDHEGVNEVQFTLK